MIDLEVRVLGPVELWLDFRQVSLGTPKQRCLLAALAMTPGRPIPVDVLVDRLWGDETPSEVRNSLYSYVARLRRTLWQESAGAVELTRNATSYSLQIDPRCVDVHHARELVDEATVAVSAGRDAAAVRLHRRALRLWRGEPLCGLRGAWAERTRAGLRQEMLTVLTECFAAELRLGRHASVIGEISAAVSEYPLDEALASQLMLCLYRSHRHADAIAVFHRIKAGLADQLGLDPGPGLRQLYGDFLRNDASLDLRATR
jgi:DNA-binding SARP family transcriptional activator